MSFRPVLPAPGLAGWRFLQRTQAAQMAAFAATPQAARDDAYFRDRIGTIRTAADLVADRRLLKVALGAFGLQDDLGNRAFIRKVLEDGTASPEALANRLTDVRYRRLSAAFGLGPGETVATSDAGRMRALVAQQSETEFAVAVGEQDDSLRIALHAQRELEILSQAGSSDDAKWFSMMGLPPLRTLFETALGLPASFGQIDIDMQLETFRDKVRAVTGSAEMAQFADPAARAKLTDRYLARVQIAAAGGATSPAANALALLTAGAA